MDKRAFLIDQIKELNDKFYEACGELKENRGHLGDKDKKVLENLYELYMLDYRLIRLNLSSVDEEIERLEVKEIKRLADQKIKKETAEEEAKQKRTETVPDRKRRWWQIRKRPNYAMTLAMQAAAIETEEYFAAREKELGLSDDEQENSPEEPQEQPVQAIEELLKAALPQPRGKRARKRWEAQIAELSEKLGRMQTNPAPKEPDKPE